MVLVTHPPLPFTPPTEPYSPYAPYAPIPTRPASPVTVPSGAASTTAGAPQPDRPSTDR
ncbi:hypothetical protein [Paenibacillus sp.]|uniref:hypothetical protein n=1 Tax=Paenibacillus sp. TaxID=58172 RepID=UPI002D3DBD50|nr:hypothetical protein [Paenibacillus sp.]HZG54974.1 hypothetical protein [Paenibacillus sp.]